MVRSLKMMAISIDKYKKDKNVSNTKDKNKGELISNKKMEISFESDYY